MKKALVILLVNLFVSNFTRAQFNLIPSGTADNHLIYISALGNDIFIGGDSGYCARSFNECKALNVMRSKYYNIYTTRWQRLTPNLVCEIHRYNGYVGGDWKMLNDFWVSDDGGVTIKNRYSSYINQFSNICMWDTTEGYSVLSGFQKTNDGGRTWALDPNNPIANYSSVISLSKPFSDSVLFTCGSKKVDFTSNRGNTFTRKNMSFDIIALTNLGTDTVFVGSKRGLAYTLDRGQNWDSTQASVWQYSPFKINNLYFKNKNLGFALGINDQGNAVVGKTSNMGQSWVWADTQLKRKLYDMAVINDSIAILVGEFGTIVRWNYAATPFVTGIKENSSSLSAFNLWPNPVNTKLAYSFTNQTKGEAKITLFDISGQIVKQVKAEELNGGSISVSDLSEGTYFVRLSINTQAIETKKILVIKD